MNKTFYLLAIVFLLSGISASAQYRSIGPRGGAAFAFYNDAGKYWLASNAGVYYSNDNGVSWKISSLPENAFACDNVLSVAANQNELYAATQNLGIFRSGNGGVTWNAVNNGLKTTGANYSDVEVAGPNGLAIRPDSGLLFLTTNQGVAWQKINFLIFNARALALSVHNNILYVVTNTGLYISPNNGTTFSNINPSITNGNLVWANDTAYLASTNGIMRSIDYGMSFTSSGLTGTSVVNVAAAGDSIFATVRSSSQDTVKFSTNGGLSFSNAPMSSGFSFKRIYDLAMAPGMLLIGSDYNLYCAPKNGSSWKACDSTFIAAAVRGLAASGPIVYAGTTPSGIFKTTDSAASWAHNGDYAHGVNGMIQCIDANGAHVYAGDTSQYYHSTDYGQTWTAGAAGLTSGNISSIYAVKTSAEVWVIQNGNFYYSLNNGATYTAVPSVGVPLGRAYYVTGMDTNLFAAATGGLYHAGSNKIFTLTTGITAPITCVVWNGSAFYAGTDGGGLFTSTDGNTWAQVIPVSPGTLPLKINALAVDSNSLVAGTDDGLYNNKASGVWKSDTLRGKIILSLLMNSGHLYVGACGGVYTQPYPPPIPVNGVGNVHYQAAELQVYPNPARNSFHIRFTAKQTSGAACMILTDVTGRSVLRQSLQFQKGRNDFEVSTSANLIPAGIYTVQILSGAEEFSQKIKLQ